MNIDLDWLEPKLIDGRCEISGLPFDLEQNESRGPFRPSVDRIDSLKGYTKENCRVIIWALNAAFAQWGEQTFKYIAKAWIASDCGAEHDRDVNAAINILNAGLGCQSQETKSNG
jgi:hypothetical protein